MPTAKVSETSNNAPLSSKVGGSRLTLLWGHELSVMTVFCMTVYCMALLFVLNFFYPQNASGITSVSSKMIRLTHDYIFWGMFFSFLILLRGAAVDKVLVKLCGVTLCFIGALSLAAAFSSGHLFNSILFFKNDISFIVIGFIVAAMSRQSANNFLRKGILALSILNVLGLFLYFVGSEFVTYWSSRYQGFLLNPKNWGYLMVLPLCWHGFHMLTRNSILLHGLGLLTTTIGIILTGSITAFGVAGFSAIIVIYFSAISSTRKIEWRKLGKSFIWISIGLAIMTIAVVSLPMFEPLRTRLDSIFLITKSNLTFEDLLLNRSSTSFSDRYFEWVKIVDLLESLNFQTFFGDDYYSKYIRGETYFYNLLMNKGLVLPVVYYVFVLIVIRQILRHIAISPERASVIGVIALWLSTLTIGNLGEAFSERFPINFLITTALLLAWRSTSELDLEPSSDISEKVIPKSVFIRNL